MGNFPFDSIEGLLHVLAFDRYTMYTSTHMLVVTITMSITGIDSLMTLNIVLRHNKNVIGVTTNRCITNRLDIVIPMNIPKREIIIRII